MIEIRGIQTPELPLLGALYEELLDKPSDPAAMAETFAAIEHDPNYYLLGAYDGERLLGSVMGVVCRDLIADCRPFMVVENVIVSAAARGKRVGRLLMEELERTGRELRCGYALLVSSGYRKEAHAFYESLGYDEDVRGFRKRLDR
ncbi:GNAT family N-acetyltransferase [Saccharibacillus sp. CPCC 101409]|uniref:GNAT family N-acetyltransferase n=1 Tax=Saccharibacillus sp. CPCC 101409 TaxID=3058041 RepID=UPI0026715889|nr:GNAT family N-acetyltransferase [Saccharibacillus sp. CPCC 101409]MDO3410849.1 GNAT family N-acetyltransferase [Saccharibacillus sp. CPCC 101409]